MKRPHRWVTVYEDPVTEQKPEGLALLREQDESLTQVLDDEFELQYWLVAFDDQRAHRWIKARR